MAETPYRESLPKTLVCGFCPAELPEQPVYLQEGVRVCEKCNWRKTTIAKLRKMEKLAGATRPAGHPGALGDRRRGHTVAWVAVVVVAICLLSLLGFALYALTHPHWIWIYG